MPETYLAVLQDRGGESLSKSVHLYALEDLLERNVTYEIKTYCPGFMSIGDDSGGRAIMIPLDNVNSTRSTLPFLAPFRWFEQFGNCLRRNDPLVSGKRLMIRFDVGQFVAVVHHDAERLVHSLG
jgi:hypothetical protein